MLEADYLDKCTKSPRPHSWRFMVRGGGASTLDAEWCVRHKRIKIAAKTWAILLRGSRQRAHPINLNRRGERDRLM